LSDKIPDMIKKIEDKIREEGVDASVSVSFSIELTQKKYIVESDGETIRITKIETTPVGRENRRQISISLSVFRRMIANLKKLGMV